MMPIVKKVISTYADVDVYKSYVHPTEEYIILYDIFDKQEHFQEDCEKIVKDIKLHNVSAELLPLEENKDQILLIIKKRS